MIIVLAFAYQKHVLFHKIKIISNTECRRGITEQ